MWLLILAGIFAFLVYSLAIKPYKYWKDKHVPFLKPVPIVGSLGPSLRRKKAFAHLTQDLYWAYPDKRYVGFHSLFTPILMIRDPELIKRILVKEFDSFPEHRLFTSQDADPLWNRNIFAMRGGQKWQSLRATVSPAFTSSKMRMMFGLIKDCGKQFTNYLQKQGGLVEIEVKDSFTRFTNDVVATTAFGITCDSLENQQNEFYLMGKDATDFGGIKGLKFMISSLSPFLMELLKVSIFSEKVKVFFRRLIMETIRIREEKNIVRPDLIHLLMEAKKGRLKDDDSASKVVDSDFAFIQDLKAEESSKKPKAQITDEDIVAQALGFFVAGFDAVSSFLCFTAYELAVNPDVQQKLRKEIDETLEKCNGDFTYEALLGMKYLDMVVAESFRKWPTTLATDRQSTRTFTIEPELPGEEPVTLEKGANIWIPIFALQRDPEYYPDPEKFDPERFSDKNKIKPYTYLPFGAGPRVCMGSRFALLEGKILIAEILSKFEIVPVEKTQIPLQFDKSNFNPAAEKGFWLGFKPRTKY